MPISKLNAVLRAVAPDLVAVDANASFDDTSPWLYAADEHPPAVMDSFIHAWLRDMQPSAELYPLFKETVHKLDAQALQWRLENIDMLQQTISPGGTSLPVPRLFRLLPETLAARIAALPPYEHCGHEIAFRRVAVDARANGAELLSWPPLQHNTKSKNDAGRAWHYSVVIRVSLRTVPFSSIPRIHISASIRRWVNGPVWIPTKRGVSIYLLANNSLVPDGLTPDRFAVAKLTWDYKTREIGWAHGGPEGMLLRISALNNLPPADVLAKEPETWITGRDGVTAAVTYQTAMGWHGVGAGIMPSERRRLVEWAAQALEPQFTRISELRRSSIKQQNPTHLLQRNLPVRKDSTDDQRAGIAILNETIDAGNADQRRPHVATAVGERGLTAVVLYQSDAMRNHLVNAAESSLGLAPYRADTGPAVWSWQTPELTVRIYARPLGPLGAPLGNEEPPRKGDQLDEAISCRRTETAAFLARLSDDVLEPAQIAFIELDGRDRFKKRTTDPKFALRLGCADAGLVSQFLRPPEREITNENDQSAFRVSAAWADGLRQIGMRFVPEHTLGDAIPERLNQVAFWMVKRRVDGPTYHPQFTPVAVLIRPGQHSIMGRTADTQDWVPYPELLKSLTGKIRSDALRTADQQSAAAAAFIQTTLYRLRGDPTLIVTHAQNTRYRWPWLQNNGLVADRIQIGGGPLQRLALHGKKLRIARVATSDRDETPEWWAPKPDGRAGLSKGLWVGDNTDETNRVFYSTSDKASTHKISVDATKLTPHINPTGKPEINITQNAWNPELLEFTMIGLQPGDNAEKWAMYLHQQRFSDDYRDGLGLPLILHLAELTSHYALPHEETEHIETQIDADTDDQPDPMTDDAG